MERGWPMPPVAPRTATLAEEAVVEEKAREAAALAVEVVATFLRAAAVADRAANILFYWKSFGDEEGDRIYMERDA